MNESSIRALGLFQGWRMAKEDRAADYLAKAKEAEEMARRAADPLTKQTWERIAEGYRDLARMPGYW